MGQWLSLYGILIGIAYSQDETSEMFIGEWAEKRGIRDQLVIATKVSPYGSSYPYSHRI